jgi:hypothetical protein
MAGDQYQGYREGVMTQSYRDLLVELLSLIDSPLMASESVASPALPPPALRSTDACR